MAPPSSHSAPWLHPPLTPHHGSTLLSLRTMAPPSSHSAPWLHPPLTPHHGSTVLSLCTMAPPSSDSAPWVHHPLTSHHGSTILTLHPGSTILTLHPGSTILTLHPGSTILTLHPGSTILTLHPGSTILTLHPGSNILTLHPDSTILTLHPGSTILTLHPDSTILTLHPGSTILTLHPDSTILTLHPGSTILTLHPDSTILTLHPDSTILTLHPGSTILTLHPDSTILTLHPGSTIPSLRTMAVLSSRSAPWLHHPLIPPSSCSTPQIHCPLTSHNFPTVLLLCTMSQHPLAPHHGSTILTLHHGSTILTLHHGSSLHNLRSAGYVPLLLLGKKRGPKMTAEFLTWPEKPSPEVRTTYEAIRSDFERFLNEHPDGTTCATVTSPAASSSTASPPVSTQPNPHPSSTTLFNCTAAAISTCAASSTTSPTSTGSTNQASTSGLPWSSPSAPSRAPKMKGEQLVHLITCDCQINTHPLPFVALQDMDPLHQVHRLPCEIPAETDDFIHQVPVSSHDLEPSYPIISRDVNLKSAVPEDSTDDLTYFTDEFDLYSDIGSEENHGVLQQVPDFYTSSLDLTVCETSLTWHTLSTPELITLGSDVTEVPSVDTRGLEDSSEVGF
ncbi:hypothetical protein NFI96_027437 [Prochilodus magdalenae]|nr:hypothetical protein NFI96_027437 [Prochilodus magdalenae]